MRALILVFCAFVLSNCTFLAVLPPAVQYASTALTVISYATTGKGTSDHIISIVAERNCALHRALLEQEICTKEVLAVVAADTSQRRAK